LLWVNALRDALGVYDKLLASVSEIDDPSFPLEYESLCRDRLSKAEKDLEWACQEYLESSGATGNPQEISKIIVEENESEPQAGLKNYFKSNKSNLEFKVSKASINGGVLYLQMETKETKKSWK